jgi:phage shock protein E
MHKGGVCMMYKKICMQTAKNQMDADPGIVVIDVRTQDEFEQGHIPGSVSIPYEETPYRVSRMIPDKNTPIYIYCSSGFCSKIACLSLIRMGYADVSDLGALPDWSDSLQK